MPVGLSGFVAFPGILTAPVLSLPAEDVSGDSGGLGGVVSTISSSRSPLQPPEADEGEPFTTYFDSKIPIPEDETVSGKTLLEKSASDTPESFPVPLQGWTGNGNLGEKWRWGGSQGVGGVMGEGFGAREPVLMIDPLGFGSCQRARKGFAIPRGGTWALCSLIREQELCLAS